MIQFLLWNLAEKGASTSQPSTVTTRRHNLLSLQLTNIKGLTKERQRFSENKPNPTTHLNCLVMKLFSDYVG